MAALSSTGHMILLNEFVKRRFRMNFISCLRLFIQLGAILAVILLFFHKLNPLLAKQERAAEAEHMAAVVQGGACGDSFRGDRAAVG